ncbi:hypothetical protein B7494_g2236 [Chlorociboria aeruginascens]|nr:hypothetical protein B7494_g2236 [Chlorociboria aeruginascens]
MEQDHMPPEEPPSYSQSHERNALHLHLPSLPPHQPPPIHHERKLPELPPPSEEGHRADPAPEPQVNWPSSNPFTAYYQPGPARLSPKNRIINTPSSPSVMEADTLDNRGGRGGSVLSIDDPDVRIAAEALGDLRADFIQSPPQKHSSLPTPSPAFQKGQQPEPLLSLLTTSHPLIGTAIGGSISAYSASKNYSPRFKSSAEYVERRFTPVVNTVGSVGRMTGVEGSVRWFLGGRRPSHHTPSDYDEGSNKRRKVFSDDQMDRNVPQDPYPVHRQDSHYGTRRPSQSSTVDSLPAYDEFRSPSYEAAQQALVSTNTDEAISPGGSWQSRLVLSTSGLSVAMSEESLRSLKYCLGWLKWANEHIGKVITALKAALEQYDSGSHSSTSAAITGGGGHPIKKNEEAGQLITRSEAERSVLNAKIAELKADVLKTLKEVIDIVSKYAGGALPENARILVRRHLTSLPQRFRMASTATVNGPRTGDGDISDGANRVMVLAKEGLDMMAQVSGVLDGTIVSAEEWCERLGRKKGEEEDKEGKVEKPSPSLNPGRYFPGVPDVETT